MIPSETRLTPNATWPAWCFFGLAGGIALLVALGGIIWGWGRVASARRALLLGEVREARITGIRPYALSGKKKPRFVVSWTDAAGVNGKSLLASAGLAQAHAPGDVIVVYVDPDNGRGWWQKQI